MGRSKSIRVASLLHRFGSCRNGPVALPAHRTPLSDLANVSNGESRLFSTLAGRYAAFSSGRTRTCSPALPASLTAGICLSTAGGEHLGLISILCVPARRPSEPPGKHCRTMLLLGDRAAHQRRGAAAKRRVMPLLLKCCSCVLRASLLHESVERRFLMDFMIAQQACSALIAICTALRSGA